jgi:hypothetical protein
MGVRFSATVWFVAFGVTPAVVSLKQAVPAAALMPEMVVQ